MAWHTASETEIGGIAAVYKTVGFETSFHNAEILKLVLDRTLGRTDVKSPFPSMTILLWTRRSLIPGEFQPGSPLWYKVEIAFYEIEDLVLNDFNHQNICGEIVVDQHDEDNTKLRVWIRSLFGAELAFLCKRAKVLSVEGTEYHPPNLKQHRQDVENDPSDGGGPKNSASEGAGRH